MHCWKDKNLNYMMQYKNKIDFSIEVQIFNHLKIYKKKIYKSLKSKFFQEKKLKQTYIKHICLSDFTLYHNKISHHYKNRTSHSGRFLNFNF